MTNPLSRMGLNHPAQGATGDATLYSEIEAIYTSIGNDMPTRLISISSIGSGATVTGQIHNLHIPFAMLRFSAYVASGSTDDGTLTYTPHEVNGIDISVAATSGHTDTQIDVTNNTGGTLTNVRILVWQDTTVAKFSKVVDPSATAAGYVYTSLAAAIAAAVVGDTILVKGIETLSSLLTINVSDLTIEWKPGAKTIVGSGSSQTAGISVTAGRVRLVAPWLRVDNTAAVYGIKVSGADCRITDALVESNNSGLTMTAPIQINSGGLRAYADLGLILTLGTITNDFEDNVGTLRGAIAR